MSRASTITASADRFLRSVIRRSALDGVSDAAWDAFVRAMSVRTIRGVSLGGGIGTFDLRPRRLGEIGVMKNLRREGEPPGRWVGDLESKYAALGDSSGQQYEVFVMSVRAYDEEILAGEIAIPGGVTRSGAHAVLHCGRRQALAEWPEGAFKTTRELFNKVNNIF